MRKRKKQTVNKRKEKEINDRNVKKKVRKNKSETKVLIEQEGNKKK